MEMLVNANLIKQERNRRAWSQEHLANVAGLGLRTIQRIETSGMASNESIASIATVFEMLVVDFTVEAPQVVPNTLVGIFQKNRLWITLAIVLVALLGSPAKLTVALVCLWVLVAFETGALYLNKRSRLKRALQEN